MDGPDPLLTGVEVTARIGARNGVVPDDGGDTGTGDDEVEILPQGEEAEATESARFAGDADHVSKSEDHDKNTENKSTRQNIPEKTRLPCSRFHDNTNFKTKLKKKKDAFLPLFEL